MSRDLSEKQLTHDRLGADFDVVMNPYDIERRLQVLVDDFLDDHDLSGKKVLDAGCGTGRGLARLAQRGAHVVALDLGMRLLRYARQQHRARAINGSVLGLPFANASFDVVYSSEVIEHTPDPLGAVQEMVRVLKPGGHLVLSTPNRLWQIPVQIASMLRLRPYNGIENFVKPAQLRDLLQEAGHIHTHRGLHLLPFQFSALRGVSSYFDQYGETLLPLMINQCIHFQKA